MNKKILSIVFFFTVILNTSVIAQAYARWTDVELKLNNGIVQRTINLPKATGQFFTSLYKPVNGEFAYFRNFSTDFQFEINDQTYSGKSTWELKKIETLTDRKNGNGASVVLISADKSVELTLQFLLYPGSPAIRKKLKIKNLTSSPFKLESIDIEKFNVTGATFSWICHDYGRRRSIGPYDGNMQDALITVHNSDWQQGVVIGNEAAGVLKHSSVFWQEESICAGLTHKDAMYPFRKYILPGETFTTPQVFTMVYNNHKDPDEILNTAVPDFVRKYMGIRLSELVEKPTFVYNTWVPFRKNIDEKLIKQLAKSAADAGMKEFVIDDGWADNYGDWNIDKKKFPNGLKPVFDYIKSLGMKPGLWVSVGSASPKSQIFKAHPEWFVLDPQQKPFNLHIEDTSIVTACFSTGWYDYIKEVLKKLTLEYGLDYLKLDFTVVTSPYRFNKNMTGCYAVNHPMHKDQRESFYVNYERVWKLFDELHDSKPSLFIDCTFETMGGLQLIDYAMLQHAEGNWLSNFKGPEAKVDLRIRNMAWWRSPAIPSTALVIGNPEMQDTAWDLHIKSLAGALPIMLGDPRKLSPADFLKYKNYADWLQLMENKHQIMMYRQDLPGFGEPMDGMWDGFQRINTDTRSGGIVGVFRQGALDTKRTIFINYLNPEKIYQVKQVNGKIIATLNGKDLRLKGIDVELEKEYDGKLFEISLSKNIQSQTY